MNNRLFHRVTGSLLKTLSLLALSLMVSGQVRAAGGCPGEVSLQVLGSGGPIANDSRASSGYLIWVDGRARLLVDAGGGSFARFGSAGANIEDLEAVLLTHMHVDHSVELPAYLKSAWFGPRKDKLPIVGPSGNREFPGLTDFMQRLFGPGYGAFQYLSGYLSGAEDYFKTPLYETDADGRTPEQVLETERLKISAVGVEHGPVPALGYLVEVKGRFIAFSGDQNGDNPQFGEMIRNVDLLVMDHAVPEDADGIAAGLHARPSEIAELAGGADVGRLLLSHIMPRSERKLEDSLEIITRDYSGELGVAEDLMCVELAPRPKEQTPEPPITEPELERQEEEKEKDY